MVYNHWRDWCQQSSVWGDWRRPSSCQVTTGLTDRITQRIHLLSSTQVHIHLLLCQLGSQSSQFCLCLISQLKQHKDYVRMYIHNPESVVVAQSPTIGLIIILLLTQVYVYGYNKWKSSNDRITPFTIYQAVALTIWLYNDVRRAIIFAILV